MTLFRAVVSGLMLLSSTAYGQSTCGVALPSAIQNRLKTEFPAFQLQTAQNLSASAKARWQSENASACPGLAVGTFESGGVRVYAALLVPKNGLARGYRLIVFRPAAQLTGFDESVLEHTDDTNAHDFFIKAVQTSEVFDSPSRVRFGISAQQAVAFFDVGQQEYEVDVYYWVKGHYEHSPLDE